MGKRAARSRPDRIGLAVAGGGPLGGIYEVGALLALDDALEGVDLNDLHIYVGVSSGSLIASCLANGLSPATLYRMYIDNTALEHPMTPDVFQTPAFKEYFERAVAIPDLLLRSLWRYVQDPLERGLWGSLQSLGRAVPTGVFDNAPVGRFLERLFTSDGRTNDFRKLPHRLCVVATELDTGESVEFGSQGHDDVPISIAVQASSALPALYLPTEINGRYFVDGALKKTLHASVALKEGASLVFCLNPLVPFDARLARAHGKPKHEKLVDAGLPVVLSQTFRALIHSRMQVGMAKYDTAYKGADVLLFEPNPDDAEMFFANVFSHANRERVCDHAYRHTMHELARRESELAPILERHGISLRSEVVRQERPDVKTSPSLRLASGEGLKHRLDSSLHQLAQWLHTREQGHAPGPK